MRNERSLRSRTIKLAYARPELRPHLLPLLVNSREARSRAYVIAQEDEVNVEAAIDGLIDNWVDGFFDILKGYDLKDENIEEAIQEASGQVDTEALNEVYAEGEGLDLNAIRTAGFIDSVRAFGGKLLSGAWHMLTGPFHALWKMLTSPQYRTHIKNGMKRAVRHEIRSSKHMVKVALRLAKGENVPPQEVRAAAIQFLDLLSKVILAWIAGPHIAHLFAKGVAKAMMALLSPLDEVAAVLLDKPLRWATQKFLGQAIGLLPSGFYTHF